MTAATVEQHEALTTGDGWDQVRSDTASLTFTTDPPVCNVYAQKLEWVSFAEKTDYNGPMVASYKGEITAEHSCDGAMVQLRVRNTDDDVRVGNTTLTPTAGDGHTYTFEGSVEVPNKYGNYKGILIAYDSSDPADQSTLNGDPELWDPPCYLEIKSFTKTGETTKADGTKADLSYTLALDHHGDNACRDMQAKVALLDANDDATFVHYLQKSDVTTAIDNAGGFNYTVSIPPTGAKTAKAGFADPRAVENKQADADGYVGGGSPDCSVTVQDFCLIDARAVSDGRYAFDFNIRAQMNTNCGDLDTQLAIADSYNNYLGHVTIGNNEIIDSFTCDCTKTFTVEADYDGTTPQEFRGQLYITDSAHQSVLITDSCVFDLE